MTATTTPLEGFEEGFVDADGFSIRYLAGGEGNVVAVVHGAGGPADYAGGPALDLLAEEQRVIAFELPGFGESEPNTTTENARQMAATLAAAMKELGIESYSVLGTSMGGVVALWWLADFNDSVTSVVLEAPAAFRGGPPSANILADRDAFIRAFHAHPERKPWLKDFKLEMPPNMEFVGKLMGPDVDEELADTLRGNETPVLLLIGDRDGIISTDVGAFFKELMPELYYIVVYKAAHDLKGDRPEAFAQVVNEFLTHGTAFVVNRESGLLNP